MAAPDPVSRLWGMHGTAAHLRAKIAALHPMVRPWPRCYCRLVLPLLWRGRRSVVPNLCSNTGLAGLGPRLTASSVRWHRW